MQYIKNRISHTMYKIHFVGIVRLTHDIRTGMHYSEIMTIDIFYKKKLQVSKGYKGNK